MTSGCSLTWEVVPGVWHAVAVPTRHLLGKPIQKAHGHACPTTYLLPRMKLAGMKRVEDKGKRADRVRVEEI